MKPYVVAAIFARGGSKGIPRKNIRLLAGKPLIAYAIETALAIKAVDRVIVSTDDLEIADVARRYGAEVPFLRPAALATDHAPEWMAWQHAIQTLEASPGVPKIDVFVCIPTTSPLRTIGDVEACLQMLLDTDADVVMTVTPAQRNPFFNMVIVNEAGYARPAIVSERSVVNRQQAPPAFDVTTVAYAARPNFILSASSLFEGRVRTVLVPSERALDLDTEWDWRIAEWLLSQAHEAHA